MLDGELDADFYSPQKDKFFDSQVSKTDRTYAAEIDQKSEFHN